MDLAQNLPTILKTSVTSLTNLLWQTESKPNLNFDIHGYVHRSMTQ